MQGDETQIHEQMNTLLKVIVDNDILSQRVQKGESFMLLTGLERSNPIRSLLSIYNVLDSLLRTTGSCLDQQGIILTYNLEALCHTYIYTHIYTYGLPQWLSSKESAFNAGDMGLIPGLERPPAGGYGNPLQNSFLQNHRDRGAQEAIVHRAEKTRLKRFIHIYKLI